jgi:hypothetical protein
MPSTASISGELICHCRTILYWGLSEAIKGKSLRYGKNCAADNCLPVYILSVNAVEAFIYESLLSSLMMTSCKHSPLAGMHADWIDKLNPDDRILVTTQLLFGWSFDISRQPFQDYKTLVQIRNKLTHYKNEDTLPKFMQPLKDRGIAMKHPKNFHNPWTHDLSCTEGVRWAHNVACAIVAEIVAHAPQGTGIDFNLANFETVTEERVIAYYVDHGIDPTTNNPPPVSPAL